MLVQDASSLFLCRQSDSFWESLGVFPVAIRLQLRPDGDLKAYHRAKHRLSKCPTANIRLLCEKAKLSTEKNATHEQLTNLLLSSCENETFTFLAEFLRRKGESLKEEFDRIFSDADKRKLQSLLRESGASRGKLRQFTQLLLLFNASPSSLKRVYLRSLWRSRPTVSHLPITRALSDDEIRVVEESINDLANDLSSLSDNRTVRFKAKERLENGFTVLFLERENAPSLTADFHQVFAHFTTFGWVMIGFRDQPPRIEIKAGDKRVVEVVSNWLLTRSKLPLNPDPEQLFTDYDPGDVESKLLGEYENDSKLDIIGIAFRRSMGPCHAPIMIESAFDGQSIRRDLMWLKERETVRVRSLADLKSLKFRTSDKTFLVHVDVDQTGVVRFRMDDTGLSSAECSTIEDEFRRQFGIPLGSPIDPTKLPMGSVDILNNLLEIDRLDKVPDFQKEILGKLLAIGVIKVREDQIRQCAGAFCQKLIEDETIDECPKCGGNVKTLKVKFLEQVPKAIIKETAKIIKDAAGWRLRSTPSSFEEHEMYPLQGQGNVDQQVQVHFTPRVNPSLLKLIDRSMLPVLVVHTGGHVETAHLDVAGVAHLGLGYALAASGDGVTKKRFNDDLTVAINGVFQRKQERVFRAARSSRDVLKNLPDDYSGTAYEQDVFNLIRSLCPHVERWGGGSRPDGFCSIVYLANGRLRESQKHNWSYDSKLSSKGEGYDLNASEKRKMFDYVEALLAQPWLQVQGNTLNGHVIITNRVSETVMKSCGQFLRRDHRLGADHSEVKLVFMLQEFLTELYDNVRLHEDEFFKRRNWLSGRLAHVMKDEGPEGYVFLDKGAAEGLVKWVLIQPEIETPLDIKKLQAGLDETMRGT